MTFIIKEWSINLFQIRIKRKKRINISQLIFLFDHYKGLNIYKINTEGEYGNVSFDFSGKIYVQ